MILALFYSLFALMYKVFYTIEKSPLTFRAIDKLRSNTKPTCNYINFYCSFRTNNYMPMLRFFLICVFHLVLFSIFLNRQYFSIFFSTFYPSKITILFISVFALIKSTNIIIILFFIISRINIFRMCNISPLFQ